MIIRFLLPGLLLISYIFPSDLTKANIDNLRNLLYASTNRESALDSLENYLTKLENVGTDSPLILAYKGASESLKAKYNFWPWEKFSNVKKGLKLLNRSVELDKENLEIRFLRFAVLHNLPSILSYSDEADTEAGIIFEMLNKSGYSYDQFLIKNIIEFLISSERLTEDQVKLIRNKFDL